MEKKILILGAGGHGRVVADCAAAAGWSHISFLDNRFPELEINGLWPVIGKLDDFEHFISLFPNYALGLGVGYEKLRIDLLRKAQDKGASFPAIVHPSAVLGSAIKLGSGTVVFARTILNIGAEAGHACIINSGAIIEHDCLLGDATHVSSGACLAGGVITGERVWIGMGAQVLQSVTVKSDALVGAGAVVISDVPEGDKVMGIPASSRT